MKKIRHLLICTALLLALLLPETDAAADNYGNTLTEIFRLSTRYQNAKTGGVALAGSSTLARWTTAADDIAEYGIYSSDQVYNFGISGARFQSLLDTRYISAIAARKPSVVVVYGANSLTVAARNASRNRTIVNQATNATIKFIEKLRAALLKKGVTDTRFLFVSAVRTPNHYRTCKAKTVSCNIWDRIVLFNKRLKSYANVVPYCEYINIEPNYYYKVKTSDGRQKLRYYLDEGSQRSKSRAVTAKVLITRRKVSPLFARDLNHPSTLAYRTVWKKVAKKISAPAAF